MHGFWEDPSLLRGADDATRSGFGVELYSNINTKKLRLGCS